MARAGGPFLTHYMFPPSVQDVAINCNSMKLNELDYDEITVTVYGITVKVY